MGRPFRIALAEGKTLHDSDGRVWQFGIPQVLVLEDHELARYERDRRFAIQSVVVDEAGKPLPPRAARPRSEVRVREPDPDPADLDDDLDEDDPAGDPSDDQDLDDETEDDEDEDPPVPSYPEKVIKLARANFDTARTSRATLEQMATVLGATGPDGEEPSKAATKEVLAGWITQRQTQIIADLARAGG